MINSKLKVYLSGPMEYAHDNGHEWRELAERQLAETGLFTSFNPCTSSQSILTAANFRDITEYKELKRTIQTKYRDRERYISTTRQFIKLDLHELYTSDIVLALVNKVSSGGTAGEITLAHYLGIPVVGFCPDDISQVSGWVLGCVDHLSFPINNAISTPLELAILKTIDLGKEILEIK
jgi:nucleoside 2-deoxyribosyltransferase